jgi:4-amino-4-deoxy-L-arabinose transferase-like glycosyltransferase
LKLFKSFNFQRPSRAELLRWLALLGIVLLAIGLRFYNLAALGDVNHYYTAAVKSMLESWHNFFFVAAEPGGSVSVDKPPLGLWIEAASAAVFGVNTFGVLFPELLSGIISILLVHHLVKRQFGDAAGLLAALALAITPVVVATDRNNTIDSILIMTLLFAAWAWIRATETGKLRYLLLGAVLVGLGFNIKMLQAYLPLPAFVALYFLGAKERVWRKIFKLGLAALVLLAVSLSWVTIVDLTPASQRPYVGSSSDNSEMNLIIGYNGLSRLFGMGRTSFSFTTQNGFAGGRNNFPVPGGRQDGGGNRAPNVGNLFNGGGIRGGNFGGGIGNEGQVGALRLVTGPLSKEASWLLPVALLGLLSLIGLKWHWPFSPRQQAAVLWGGWLLTAGAFFSVAGFFHEYYLSMLGAPLAALTGIGIIGLWQLLRQRPWLGICLLAVVAAVTLWLQFYIARLVITTIPWRVEVWAVALVGIAVVAVAALLGRRWLAGAGFSLAVFALLVTPGIWSALTVLYPSVNQSLPAAYDGTTRALENSGGLQVSQSLLTYLEQNTQGDEYLMAVPSSMQGADYVIDTGKPVLYMGGFMGIDPVVNASDLQKLVEEGKLRYIYYTSGGGNLGGQGNVTSWVKANCQVVKGYNTQTVDQGNPDGTGGAPGGMGSAGGPGVFSPGLGTPISLYDCKKS